MPCALLSTAVASGLPYIKIAANGVMKDVAPVVIDGKVVTIYAAAGAILDRDGDGPILEVKSAGADVKIYDLQISGASGLFDANGVLLTPNGGIPKLALTRVKVTGNASVGVRATGGSLSIAQSTISSNGGVGVMTSNASLSIAQSRIALNTGGGLQLNSGTFSIVSNIFYGNGNVGGTVGGVSLATSPDAANRLEFNSLYKNTAQDGIAHGIQCIAGTFTARNNIIAENGTMSQVGGACAHIYSIARPGTLPAGTGNSASDPMFIDTTTGDLHISSTSPARGMADPASNLSEPALYDIDGDLRSNPADIGADEIP